MAEEIKQQPEQKAKAETKKEQLELLCDFLSQHINEESGKTFVNCQARNVSKFLLKKFFYEEKKDDFFLENYVNEVIGAICFIVRERAKSGFKIGLKGAPNRELIRKIIEEDEEE